MDEVNHNVLKLHLSIVSMETSLRRHAYADDKPLLLLGSAPIQTVYLMLTVSAHEGLERLFSVWCNPLAARTHQHVKATGATNQGIRMGRGREGKSGDGIKEVSVAAVGEEAIRQNIFPTSFPLDGKDCN